MSVDVTYLDHLDRGREYLQTVQSILRGLDRDQMFLTPDDAFTMVPFFILIHVILNIYYH